MDAIDPGRADRGRRAGRARGCAAHCADALAGKASAEQLAEPGGVTLTLQAGGPGETCLVGLDRDGKTTERLRRCSHGLIHPPARASALPGGPAQPDARWRGSATARWLDRTLRRVAADGSVQVLPPAPKRPASTWAGAGRLPGRQTLVAREAEAGGKLLRRFEGLSRWPRLHRRAGAPALERRAGLLGAFQRGSDAAWKGAARHRLALRRRSAPRLVSASQCQAVSASGVSARWRGRLHPGTDLSVVVAVGRWLAGRRDSLEGPAAGRLDQARRRRSVAAALTGRRST